MSQFQKYSAIFSDPMIMDALAREIPNINKTAKNSVDRFKALQKLYDTVLPPELVARYRRTFAGLQETFNTAIFGPETGLFGLGRKMQGLGKKMNEFGEYIDWYGKVTTNVNEAMNADLSIYDLFRDIIVNTGQVLAPIVENFTLLWDPLQKIGLDLKKARDVTAAVLRSFHGYIKGWEDFEKGLSKDTKLLFQQGGGAPLRAALSTIANLLAEVGAIGDADFSKYTKMMEDPSAKLGPILQDLVDKLLNSDVAKSIGEMIGTIVGTVLVEVSKVTGLISGRIEKSNKLVKGFQDGFKAAGGEGAFTTIFKDVFTALFNVLKMLWDVLPWQAKLLGALAIAAPAVIQGGAMLIAESIGKGLLAMFKGCAKKIPGAMGGACPTMPGGRQITGEALTGRRRSGAYGEYRGRPQRYGPGGSIDRLNRRRRASMARGAAGARVNAAYAAEPFVNMARTSRAGQAVKGLGRGIAGMGRGVGKLIPGGAALAGAVDLGLSLATGEDFGKAAAGAIGTVIGGAAGTIFGPAGTVIGGIVGGMVGDAAHNFVTVTMDQNKAAAMQLEAAQKQVEAAASAATRKYGPTFGEKLGGVEALNQALGGGAGVKAYADEQLRLGKITAEQAQSWGILGGQLTEVNKITTQVEKAQKQYDTAVRLNTGQQEKYKKVLEDAQGRQQEALTRITTNWEQMSATSRTRLLQGADNIVAALDGAAAKIRGWRGIPAVTPAPPPRNPSLIPPSTSTPIDRPPAQRNVPPTTSNFGFDPVWKGSLGDAVAAEMKNKPAGSDLLIANSSETVIPAAGGYGMKDFMNILSAGFSSVNTQYQSLASGVNTLGQTTDAKFQQSETQNADRYQKTSTTIGNYHKQTQEEFGKINQNILSLTQQVATMSSMGGMLGGMGGGMELGGGYGGAGVQIAGQLGNYIKQTGGAPGSIWEHPMHGGVKGKHAPGSYHYSGRAIDIGAHANEQAGVIARIKQFNAKYGVKPVEFLHAGNDPNHQDHVHVAYALGYDNGRMFTTLDAAKSWENSMVPGSVKVASITGNSAEGFGGETNVINNITINQQPGQDADELAAIVALKIGDAVADARAASLFV
jgi:hypothetical protein